jgi:hypothetical protein
VDWTTVALGLGAFITGIGGVMVAVHEFRRRDRRALNDEGREMSDDLARLRHDLVVCRRYAYDLADRLARHGHDVPDPP